MSKAIALITNLITNGGEILCSSFMEYRKILKIG